MFISLHLFLPFREMTGSASAKGNRVPVQDQQVALALILELAVQRSALGHLLSAVLLLLHLWSSSRHDCDNRFTTNLISAPLVPLLRRFSDIQMPKARLQENKIDEVRFSYSTV